MEFVVSEIPLGLGTGLGLGKRGVEEEETLLHLMVPPLLP